MGARHFFALGFKPNGVIIVRHIGRRSVGKNKKNNTRVPCFEQISQQKNKKTINMQACNNAFKALRHDIVALRKDPSAKAVILF